jgi:hypothetical protein
MSAETFKKRQKEAARREKQQKKLARRSERRNEKAAVVSKGEGESSEIPEIASKHGPTIL